MDESNFLPPKASHACYLLGFSPASEPIQTDELVLLSQLGVEQLVVREISVWYTQIERTEFEGPVAEKNLADLQWLTPRVLAHESINSNLSQRLPFYPSRFGTLFSAIERLAEFTEHNTPLLMPFFDRVRGKQEWGLKFLADNALYAQISAQRDGIVENGRPTSGGNYLKLRRRQRTQSHETKASFATCYEQAIEDLQRRYGNVITRPVYHGGTESTEQRVVGQIALLAKQEATDELLAWANQWNSEHYPLVAMHIQLTGPWPAYSFCPSLSDSTAISEAA